MLLMMVAVAMPYPEVVIPVIDTVPPDIDAVPADAGAVVGDQKVVDENSDKRLHRGIQSGHLNYLSSFQYI